MFKKIIKKHGKFIIEAVVITAATIAVFLMAHDIATAERGYEALGGEVFAFLIPYFIWLAPKLAEPFKAVKNDDDM